MGSKIGPADEKEEEKILSSALEEVRFKYNRLSTDYNALSSKIFTLIATELVITTFIFTFKISDKKPLFILDSVASIVIFGIGLTCVFIALGLLFWATTSNKWASPAEVKELSKLNYRTHIDYLRETKDDYIEAYQYCRGRYDQRRVAFDYSVMAFVFGVILLMVIKIGG